MKERVRKPELGFVLWHVDRGEKAKGEILTGTVQVTQEKL